MIPPLPSASPPVAGSLLDALCCPRCAGRLGASGDDYLCQTCGRVFPLVGTIPCLVTDPDLWRTSWQRQLQGYARSIELRVARIHAEAETPGLMARTRLRLHRIASAFTEQRRAVMALGQPLDEESDPLLAAAIPDQLEELGEVAILRCYDNIFRDWAWGQRECEVMMSLVGPLVPKGLDRIAVLGAGSGRLAADLHQDRAPLRTLALDVNPLPLLVAARVLAHDTVTLPEFPSDPLSDADVVLPRTLGCPYSIRDGFSLLVADGLQPPLPAGSVDAVVTAWFIDVARTDLHQTAAAINRLLRPGGLWVNVGPLRFQAVLSRAYTSEEVLEIVESSGFALTAQSREHVPYVDSPASGVRRTDAVLCFGARKAAEARAIEMPESLAPWIADPFAPIPITPELVTLGRRAMFVTRVLAMIDGTRSIADVARELGRAWGVDPAQVQRQLRGFLSSPLV